MLCHKAGGQAGGLSAVEAAQERNAIWRAWRTADGVQPRAWKHDLAKRAVVRTSGEKPPTGWPTLIALDKSGEISFPGMSVQLASNEESIDAVLGELIASGDVDSNRIYLQGHLAGDERALRLGLGAVDRWAAIGVDAASIPLEKAPIENLRNTPLQLTFSGSGAQGASAAKDWGTTLAMLRDDGNPDEYVFNPALSAAPGTEARMQWMCGKTRNPVPKHVAWTPSGSARNCYWLRLEDPVEEKQSNDTRARATIDARIGGQLVTLAVKGLTQVTIRLDDRLLDLDRPLTVTVNDEEVFTGQLRRDAAVLVRTLEERGDPELMFCAELNVNVPPPFSERRKAADASATDISVYPAPDNPQLAAAVQAALVRAGGNELELRKALRAVPGDCRPGLYYLITNMPQRDLVTLDADFLVENVKLAYEAWRRAPWSALVCEQQFFQYILPYAHFNERRDNWRRDFYQRFHERAWEFRDPIDAAKWLNDTLNDTVNVHYDAFKRPKSDQSPYESIAATYASCTGLSVLLADACRAVGISARLAGVARWLGTPGNHTWVEVWGGPMEADGAEALRRWYNVGDSGSDPRKNNWVDERCREQTDPDQALHRVYAACFRQSELHFPLAWNLDLDYVPALNVTRFYKTPMEIDLAVPAGRHEVTVYWADEILLTATGQSSLRLPLAHGEHFRVIITKPDGSQEERLLAP
jgi:transglutaminase-like putative cysteine protease